MRAMLARVESQDRFSKSVSGWQMTELSSAVQRAFISTRFHGGVSIYKTKNIKPKTKP
jgi:hypothetical protein